MWAVSRGLKNLRPTSPLLKFRAGYKGRVCAEDPGPRCARMSYPPKDSAADCTKVKRMFEVNKPKTSYVEMWANPSCCQEQTCDINLRYDDLYWKPTDKEREYMQTWVECPEPKLLPIVCPNPKFDYCEPEKRVYKKRIMKECDKYNDIGLMKCKQKEEGCCPKIKLPNCKSIGSLKCHIGRRTNKTKSKRICTPYPSFSECLRDPPGGTKSHECNCLVLPMYCELLDIVQKEEKMGLRQPKTDVKK